MAPDPGCAAGALLLQLVPAHFALVNMLLSYSNVLPPTTASPSSTSSSTPTSAPTSASWTPSSTAPRSAVCLYDLLGMNKCSSNSMMPSGPLERPGLNECVLGDVKAPCMTKCYPAGVLAPTVARLPRVHPAGAHLGDYVDGAFLHETSCTYEGFSVHVKAPCMSMIESLPDGVLAASMNECPNVLTGANPATMSECSNVYKSPCKNECLPDGARPSSMNVCLPDGALTTCMNECLPDGGLTSGLKACRSDVVSDHSLHEPLPDWALPCSEEDDVVNPHFEAFMDSLTLDEFKVWESDAFDYLEPSILLKTPRARERRPAKKKSFPFNDCLHSADNPSGPGKANTLKSEKFFTSNINVAAGSAAPCTGPPRALL
mmetsp:Transcript_46308/g.143253  ORF Transcript_46308/g.143253 Transcript_46308/m.143253 type:complete len:374 (-) Transcript_46308:46-1167(-)